MHRRIHAAEPYLLAIATVAAALLLRVPVWEVLGSDYPFLTFFPAVAIGSRIAGWRCGALTTILSGACSAYFLMEPRYTFAIQRIQDIVGLWYFFAIAGLLVWFTNQMQQAKKDAEAQKRLLRQTLASIGDGVIATDTEARITFINKVAEQLTGWQIADALGQPVQRVFQITHEETGAELENPLMRVLRDGQTAGLEDHALLQARDGQVIPIDDSGAPIRDRDGTMIGAVLVFRDISERRSTERRIRETEHQLTQLAKSDVIGVLFGDVEGRIRDANNEFLRIIGRTREDLASGALSWREISPSKYREIEDKALAEARERGACTPYEKEYLQPDGTRVPVLVGYILLEPERERSVAFIADLTERKKAEQELRRINEDLQLFTYGASHDLKEPLRMVGSYSKLLVRRYKGALDADADEYLKFIVQGVQRMTALVDALLEYSRAGEVPHNPASTSAEAALHDSLVSLNTTINESHAEVTYDPLPVVRVDAVHLTQIFQNLIGNGIKYAGPEPPRIHVQASQENGMWSFIVKDNGIGIAPEHHEHVFAAFQRLHGPERSGTGLGLSTCRRIVERYGGEIRVESDGTGNGSRFCFTLPAANTGSAKAD